MLQIPDEVAELLRKDNVRKNFRVHFPNGERGDLGSREVEEKSVKLAESICTGRELKFGLCEASVLEFMTYNVGNIKNMEIECRYEIDVSELVEDGFEEYETAGEVPYPFYPIPIGRFKVNDCKRQNDMERRRVTAYSNMINLFEHLHPVEKAKLECKIKDNVPYIFNPVHYALSAVGMDIDFEWDALDRDSTYSPDFNNNGTQNIDFLIPYLESSKVRGTISGKWLRLADHLNHNKLLEYEQAVFLTIEQIKNEINSFLPSETKAHRLYNYWLEKTLEKTIPLVECKEYRKSTQTYLKKREPIPGKGLIHTRFNGSDSLSIFFPSSFAITCNGETLTKTFRSSYVRVDKIKGFKGINFQGYEISIGRIKTDTGEYVADMENMPNATDIIKDYLALNALFLKQDRNTGKYRLQALQDGYFPLYPSPELFPGEDVFPSTSDIELTQKDYIEIWYDDEESERYLACTATFKDGETEEDATITVYAVDAFANELLEDLADSGRPAPRSADFVVSGDDIGISGLYIASNCPIEWVEVSNASEETIYDDSDIVGYNYVLNFDGISAAALIHVSFGTPAGWTTDSVRRVQLYRIDAKKTEGYKTYNLSKNWFLKNYNFESDEVRFILDRLLTKIQNISYMPAEITLIGMPQAEAGDTVTAMTKDGGINTIILRQTITGIKGLISTFESK